LSVQLPAPYHLAGGARTPIGFALCDVADRCRYTDAHLTAPNAIELTVSADDHKLRYLWADSALASLFDGDGVPLPPFEEMIPGTPE